MQQFFINQNSELPNLRMELLYDGRSDFHKFFDAVQNSEITFTMTNIDTNVIKICNAKAYIKLKEGESCKDEYLICYDWKKRDTRDKGVFKGTFSIKFNDTLTSEELTYPNGELIVPIREELIITIS